VSARRWGLLVGAVYVAILLATSAGVGITRDEGYYFHAARDYIGWFEQAASGEGSTFSKPVIDRFWSYNPEHPVLMKTAFALSERLFHDTLRLLGEVDAYRLPGMLMGGLCLALMVVLGAHLWSLPVGLLGALLLGVQPRFFYHAHLACFDTAITALWLATVTAYVLRKQRFGHLRLGLVFGLAIATKHNALFLPIVFMLHWMWVERAALFVGLWPRPGRGASGFHLPPIPWWVFAMGLIGPLVFLAHWPYLWPDPIARWASYWGFHLHHEHYPVRYFGTGLWEPPFPLAFPWVMWGVTIPVATLICALAGVATALRQVGRELWWGEAVRPDASSLLLLNLAIPVLLIGMPEVPIFGGTKHWMNALPFLTLFAAQFAWVAACRCSGRGAVRLGLAAALVLPGAISCLRHHPHGIGSYNSLVGGVRGAASAGFERQFWGGGSAALLALVNERAEPRAKVFFDRTNREAFDTYQATGMLRGDLRFSPRPSGADWAFAFHQPDSDWVLVDLRQRMDLVAGVAIEGVPVVSLFSGRR
jgi:4-amino-4-deoxy-L-arabinose transferase-like glycosyltransferase